MNKEQEQQLVSIVSLANLQIQQFEKERNGQGNVILLVGMTGSGKSTIFNFLIGAQFKPREGSQPFRFDLEKNSDQYSVMKEGCNSVTKVPKCYFSQQYKTLIVDFPGFNDTNGEIDEIVIQSLFNKITSKSNVKIVLVIYQPQIEFQNRGVELQTFLNEVFRNETVNMDKFTLLMNRFEDEQYPSLIEDWQNEIKKDLGKIVGKIVIQREIEGSEDIKQYFSDQQRDKIWKEIIETPQVQLEPFKFKNSTLINNYLIESINLILCQTFQELDSKLSLLTDLNLQQLEGLIQCYNNILRIIKDSTLQNLSYWMNDYLKSLEQISKALNFQSQLKYNSQDFLQVYQFFLDFSNELEGYGLIKTVLESILKSCEITLQNLNNTYQNLKILQKEIQEKQEEIQKRKQAEEETKKVKNELQQTQRDLSKTQENLKRESEEKNKAILAKNQAQEDQKKAEKETETVKQELSETEKIKEQTLQKLDISKKDKVQAVEANEKVKKDLLQKCEQEKQEQFKFTQAEQENKKLVEKIDKQKEETIKFNQQVSNEKQKKSDFEIRQSQIQNEKISLEQRNKANAQNREMKLNSLKQNVQTEESKLKKYNEQKENEIAEKEKQVPNYEKTLSNKKLEIDNELNKLQPTPSGKTIQEKKKEQQQKISNSKKVQTEITNLEPQLSQKKKELSEADSQISQFEAELKKEKEELQKQNEKKKQEEAKITEIKNSSTKLGALLWAAGTTALVVSTAPASLVVAAGFAACGTVKLIQGG